MDLAPIHAARSSELIAMDEVRSLLDAAHDAVVATDEDGLVREWNAAAAELLGWSREDVLGRRMADLLVPARFEQAHREGFERHRRTGETRLIGRRVEVAARRRDGSEVPVELTLSKASLHGRACYFAVMHDVTDRRRLVLERARTQQLLATTTDGMIACAVDGTVLSFNAAAERIFGHAADDAVGRPLEDLGLEDLAPWTAHVERPAERLTTGRHADGHVLDLVVAAVPLAGAEEPADVLLVVHDLTRVRRAEAELLQAQDRFDGLFESASIGMAVLDADARVVVVNHALGRLLGRDEDALLGRRADELVASDRAEELVAASRGLIEGGADAFQLDLPLLRADGEPFDVHLSVSAARHAETGHVLHLVWQVQPR